VVLLNFKVRDSGFMAIVIHSSSSKVAFKHDVDKRQYYLCHIYIFLSKMQIILATKELNRIRVVLAELNKKNKWLADELSKNQATVSQWCNNMRQPSVETLFEIANALDVNVRKLLVPTKDNE
jgi:hypothetical protein